MERIAIIGGGPAGFVTAIYAKKENNQVFIFEKNAEPLKKLLLTGNGKCNFWNRDQDICHYHSKELEDLTKWIHKEMEEEVLDFFQNLGIVYKEKNGYFYPYSNQAISIKNALIEEAQRKRVLLKTNSEIKSIQKENEKFLIQMERETLSFDKVVLATGSYAYPKTGSTGDGYLFAKNLGHSIKTPLPSLVQLELERPIHAEGVRSEVKVSIFEDQQFLKEEEGEIQITSYGVSGICIFNLSRYASIGLEKKKKMTLKINFLPFLKENAYSWFCEYSEKQQGKKMGQILDGILNYKLGNEILNISHISKEMKWQDLREEEKKKLVQNLTELSCIIKGTKDFSSAQVACGGVSIKEVDEHFESKIVPNLYFVGELLDIDGDCGGYNLGFAWLSGMIVGKSIHQ